MDKRTHIVIPAMLAAEIDRLAGMRATGQARTEALLNGLDYYEVTWAVAQHAGPLKRDGYVASLAEDGLPAPSA